MARPTTHRILFVGTLVAEKPVHFGSGTEGAESDAMLARDGQGRLYASGTALAGPIRRYLTHYLADHSHEPNTNADELLGFQGKDNGAASRLVVDDAIIDSDAATEVRDSVAISRDTGVACDQLKFDREVLAKGTRLPLRLEIECENAEQAGRFTLALASLVMALKNNRIRFGAGKSRGLGCLRLSDTHETRCFQTQSRKGICYLLRHLSAIALPDNIDTTPVVLPNEPLARESFLAFDLQFRCVGPMMVKAAVDGDGVDSLPLVSDVGNNQVAPVLPGSSIKGVFRTTAERILRTILRPESVRDDAVDGFQSKLDELELTSILFGRGGDNNESNGGSQSAISVDDCYPSGTFTALPYPIWQSIAAASVDVVAGGNGRIPLRNLLDRNGLTAWTIGFRIAIDRWTGGASDGMFFKILEPRGIPWEAIRVEVNLERLPQDLRLPALVLWFLVLQEMAAGNLALGHGANRNMGHVVLDRVTIAGHSLPQPLQALDNATLQGPNLIGALNQPLVTEMREAWQTYLTNREQFMEPAV